MKTLYDIYTDIEERRETVRLAIKWGIFNPENSKDVKKYQENLEQVNDQTDQDMALNFPTLIKGSK